MITLSILLLCLSTLTTSRNVRSLEKVTPDRKDFNFVFTKPIAALDLHFTFLPDTPTPTIKQPNASTSIPAITTYHPQFLGIENSTENNRTNEPTVNPEDDLDIRFGSNDKTTVSPTLQPVIMMIDTATIPSNDLTHKINTTSKDALSTTTQPTILNLTTIKDDSMVLKEKQTTDKINMETNYLTTTEKQSKLDNVTMLQNNLTTNLPPTTPTINSETNMIPEINNATVVMNTSISTTLKPTPNTTNLSNNTPTIIEQPTIDNVTEQSNNLNTTTLQPTIKKINNHTDELSITTLQPRFDNATMLQHDLKDQQFNKSTEHLSTQQPQMHSGTFTNNSITTPEMTESITDDLGITTEKSKVNNIKMTVDNTTVAESQIKMNVKISDQSLVNTTEPSLAHINEAMNKVEVMTMKKKEYDDITTILPITTDENTNQHNIKTAQTTTISNHDHPVITTTMKNDVVDLDVKISQDGSSTTTTMTTMTTLVTTVTENPIHQMNATQLSQQNSTDHSKAIHTVVITQPPPSSLHHSSNVTTTVRPTTTTEQAYPYEAEITEISEEITTKPTKDFKHSDFIGYEVPCGMRKISDMDDKRIVNGTDSGKGEFPWMVSIQLKSGFSWRHICGAVVISRSFVLTAGHCVAGLPLSSLSVVAGDHNLYQYEGSEQRSDIVRIMGLKGSDVDTFKKDIALLQLEHYFKFDNKSVSPICLPSPTQKFPQGTLAVVTGWGRLSEGGTLPQILQKVSLPIMNKDVCKKMYEVAGYGSYLHSCQICSGVEDGGSDSCQGDSGGPLACKGDDDRYYLCGVVSWGVGCARPRYPGIYTKISCYSQWISDVLYNRPAAMSNTIDLS